MTRATSNIPQPQACARCGAPAEQGPYREALCVSCAMQLGTEEAQSRNAAADRLPEPEIEFIPLEPGRWFAICRYLIIVDPGRGVACSCTAGKKGRRCHHVRELMRRQETAR